MRYLISFILLSLFCALLYGVHSLFIEEKKGEIAPELLPFVNEWKADMKSAGIDYDMGFNDIKSIRLGKPLFNGLGRSDLMSGLIQISPENFKLGEFSTKTTVYHELGHYVLKLEHNSCIIMEKGNRKESFYRENWEGCLTEYISAAGKD